MIELILKYLSVAGLASLKMVPAVALAGSENLSAAETFFSLVAGGITGVSVFTYFGKKIRDAIQNFRNKRTKKKVLTKNKIRRMRLIIKIWRRFGILGVAFLTPPFFSPPIGPAIAIAFGERPKRIIIFLSISVILWSFGFAILEETLLNLFHDPAPDTGN